MPPGPLDQHPGRRMLGKIVDEILALRRAEQRFGLTAKRDRLSHRDHPCTIHH